MYFPYYKLPALLSSASYQGEPLARLCAEYVDLAFGDGSAKEDRIHWDVGQPTVRIPFSNALYRFVARRGRRSRKILDQLALANVHLGIEDAYDEAYEDYMACQDVIPLKKEDAMTYLEYFWNFQDANDLGAAAEWLRAHFKYAGYDAILEGKVGISLLKARFGCKRKYDADEENRKIKQLFQSLTLHVGNGMAQLSEYDMAVGIKNVGAEGAVYRDNSFLRNNAAIISAFVGAQKAMENEEGGARPISEIVEEALLTLHKERKRLHVDPDQDLVTDGINIDDFLREQNTDPDAEHDE